MLAPHRTLMLLVALGGAAVVTGCGGDDTATGGGSKPDGKDPGGSDPGGSDPGGSDPGSAEPDDPGTGSSGSGGDPGAPAPASRDIGKAGGKVELDDGLALDVPKGALSEDVTIEAKVLPDGAAPTSLGEIELLSQVYELLPDGLQFQTPIEVSIPYQGGDKTVLAFNKSSDGTVEAIEVASADGSVAVVKVPHFSQPMVARCTKGAQYCFSDHGRQGERKSLCATPVEWELIRYCEAGEVCVAGHCTCKDACGKRQCGSVCGESCGRCEQGQTCNAEGQCECAPQCEGKSCGDDGCGGSCGDCAGGKTCMEGQCVTSAPTCTPACPATAGCLVAKGGATYCECPGGGSPCGRVAAEPGVCCAQGLTCNGATCTDPFSCDQGEPCGEVCCPLGYACIELQCIPAQ